MGIKQVLSAPRSPWQRAYVERVIGTIRRECLDHVIVFNEAGLSSTPPKIRGLLPSESHAPGLAEGHARVSAPSKHQKPGGSSRSRGGRAPSSLRTSRRLNRPSVSGCPERCALLIPDHRLPSVR